MNLGRLADSPLGAVLKLAFVVLGGEFVIMLAIEGAFKPVLGKEVPPYFWEFLDPILLCVIVAPVLHYAVLRPMREQQAKLEQQKDELAIAAVTFDAQEGVIVTDSCHTILKVNHAFTAVTGYVADEAVGKTPAILHSGRQDAEFYRRMREILERDKYWQGEIYNRRKNGEIYPEWLTITAVAGEHGSVNYVGIFSDITGRKAAEEKISFLAYHDRLTELPNRELFYDRLSQAMSQARRKGSRLALLFIDLDGFKAVNDNYGHEAGDEILRASARRLQGCVRNADTVCRLGGDEFAIVLGEIERADDVIPVAEKIIRELGKPVQPHAAPACSVGASIGIAIYPDDGGEIDSLMSAADGAMYQSKAAGKNRHTLSMRHAHGEEDGHPWIVLGRAQLLGISEIDRQHLELASMLNKLNAAVRSNGPTELIVQLFDEFIAEVRAHFKAEDRMMDEYGYGERDSHKAEHQRLIAEVGFLEQKFIRGGEWMILHSLKEWLLSHVQHSDRRFADFLKRRGVK